MMLKHFTWDSILINHGRLSSAEQAEITYLKELLVPADVSSTLNAHLAFIPVPLFEKCLRALEKDCSSVSRIRAGHQLLKVLHPYARRPRWQDVGIKFYRRLSWGLQRKVLKRSRKRRLCHGGLMIAMVGGDGAGKSTSLDHLNTFLSEHMDVMRLHVGKPAWSWGTTIIRAVLKAGRTMKLYDYIDHTIRYDPERQAALGFPGYPCLVREVCTARDRFIAISKAMSQATNGVIVLCDRYPVENIQLMEGPVVAQLAGENKDRKFVRLLINWEESYYKKITSPDALIVLRLDPMTAVARKPEEDPEFVRMRSEEIWQYNWSNTAAFVIESSRPVPDVLSTLRTRIWAAL